MARISIPRAGFLVKLSSSHAWPSSSFRRGASSTARSSPSSFSPGGPPGTARIACTAAHAFSRFPAFASFACRARKCRASRLSASRSAFARACSERREELAGVLRQVSIAQQLRDLTAGEHGSARGFRDVRLQPRDRDLGECATGDCLAEDRSEGCQVVLVEPGRSASDDCGRAGQCGPGREGGRVRPRRRGRGEPEEVIGGEGVLLGVLLSGRPGGAPIIICASISSGPPGPAGVRPFPVAAEGS